MRKSFTRLFSLFALFCVLGLQVVYGGVVSTDPAISDPMVDDVELDIDLTITFANPVSTEDNISGKVIELYDEDDDLVDAIYLPSSRMSISGTTVTLDIRAMLEDETEYYVVFPGDVLKETKPDGIEVPFAGFAAGDWEFETGDYTAPVLVLDDFYPANGEVNVGSASNPNDGDAIKSTVLRFGLSESIEAVEGKYFNVYNSNGEIHEMIEATEVESTRNGGSYLYEFATSNLRENTEYYVLIDEGAFVDDAENSFAGITDSSVWTFTTRDYTAPVFMVGRLGNETTTSFDFTVNVNDDATLAYVVYNLNDVNPVFNNAISYETLVALDGAKTLELTANTTETITVETYYNVNADQGGDGAGENNLSGQTSYVVYFAAKNGSDFYSNESVPYVADNLASQVSGLAVSTEDIQAPSIADKSTDLTPADNAVNVASYLDGMPFPGHGVVGMLFDENVYAGSGNIILKKASDNSVVESVDVTTGAVSFLDSHPNDLIEATDLVQVTFSTRLDSKTNYYITIAEGVIVDKAGNKFKGYAASTDWNFTSVDYVAPVVTFSTPSEEDEGLLQQTSVVKISFDEDIFNADDDAFDSDDAALSVAVEKGNRVLNPADYSATYSSAEKTITVDVDWDENSTYTVKLLKEKVYDSRGNEVSIEQSSTYETDSWLAPMVANDSYTEGNIASTDNIQFSFSETVLLAGGTEITNDNIASLITIVHEGVTVPFTATYNSFRNTATITPESPFTSEETYTVNVSAGYEDTNVKGGANSGSAKNWTVDINDEERPTVTFDFVKTNVSLTPDLELEFSEPVLYNVPSNLAFDTDKVILRKGSESGEIIPLRIINQSNETVFTLQPTIELNEGTTYYLAVADSSFIDNNVDENYNIGASTTFETEDTPDLASSVPAAEATEVSRVDLNTDKEISLTFDEAVQYDNTYAGGNVVEVYQYNEQVADVLIATATDTELSFSGSTVTVDLIFEALEEFEDETTYYLVIDGDAIKDSDGSHYVGAENDPNIEYDFYFTTGDETQPEVVGAEVPGVESPSSDAALAEDIQIYFDEPIAKGTGSFYITDYTYDGQDFTEGTQTRIDVNSADVAITNDFDHDEYYVSIAHDPFTASLYNDGAVKYYVVSSTKGILKDMSSNQNEWDGLELVSDFSLDNLDYLAAIDQEDYDIPYDTQDFNGLASIYTNNAWVFATDENDAPYVMTGLSTPADESDKVSTSANLNIVFNEDIELTDEADEKTIGVYILVGQDYSLAQEYYLSSPNVDVDGNMISVELVDLAENAEYRITVADGAVEDDLGVESEAVTLADDWYFSTGDVNAPIITDFAVSGFHIPNSPMYMYVSRNTDITITFDEPIMFNDNGTYVDVDSDNLVNNGSDNTDDANIITIGERFAPNLIFDFNATISEDAKTITISNAEIFNDFESYTNYVVSLKNIVDATDDHHAMATADYVLIIGDYTAPAGTLADPYNTTATVNPGLQIIENKNGTDVTVALNYDEDAIAYYQLLAATAATPSVSYLIDNGTPVTVNGDFGTELTIATDSETEYKLVVVATDVTNYTAQEAVEVHAFKTADITVPTVAVYGDNGAIDIDPTEENTLTLTFADDIAVGSGNIYFYRSADNVLAIAIDNHLYSLGESDELEITIPQRALAQNTEYYVNIDKGVVTDVAETIPTPNIDNGVEVNVYPGLFDQTTYTFSTTDTEDPYIVSSTPYDAGQDWWLSTSGTPDGEIVATFNEDIVVAPTAGRGDITIKDDNGRTIEVIILTDTEKVTIDGNTLTIDPEATLTDGEHGYEIIFKEDIVADAAGNTNDDDSWHFDIADSVSPAVSFLTEDADGDEIDADLVNPQTTGAIYVEFSEVVRMLDNSEIIPADVDTLVSLVDASGHDVAFHSRVGVVEPATYPDDAVVDADGDDNFSYFVITPDRGLGSNVTYTISFGEVFEDDANNVVAAQSVTFTTQLKESPSVVFSPSNNSVDVAVDESITITFNRGIVEADYTGQDVAIGYFNELINDDLTDYLALTDGTGEAKGFDATINAEKTVITIDPRVSFDSEEVVLVTFNPAGIDDVNSDIPDLVDSLNNFVDADLWNPHSVSTIVAFTVVDNKAPEVVLYEDGDELKPMFNYNDAYLPANRALTVTFDEDVQPGTGNINIYRSNGTLAETIDASTLVYAKDFEGEDIETTLVIDPQVARGNNEEYYVTIPVGAILDQATTPNSYAGIAESDYSTWTYFTADSYTVFYTDLTPEPESDGVYVYESLTITFDKEVDLGGGIISIYDEDGNAHDLIRVEDANDRIELDPTTKKTVTIDFERKPFKSNTKYYVLVEEAAFTNAKTDGTNEMFQGIMDPTVWTFTTEDLTAPEMIATTPEDDATEVGGTLLLSLTFDMDVMAGTGSVDVVETATGTLVQSVDITDENSVIFDGNIVRILYGETLEANTNYHVVVDYGAITNTLPSHVAYAGLVNPDKWNFTTGGDVEAPTIVSLSPSNNEVTENNHPMFEMVLSEDVQLSSIGGSAYVIPKYMNLDTIEVELDPSMFDGSTITFTYEYDSEIGGMNVSTTYYVLVDPGAIEDTAGNMFVGISDTETWVFKTGDDLLDGTEDPVVDSQEYIVYPNPFENELKIDNIEDLSRIIITNVAGQRVKDIVDPTGTISAGDLSSGIYFITLIEDDVVVKTERIVKR